MTINQATVDNTIEQDQLRTISLDDERVLSYAEFGSKVGRPVVFFHGTPGSHVLGRLLHEDAMRAGARILAIDRPGYSKSSPDKERTLSDTGDYVTAVFEDADVSGAHAIGFSGGGPHALAAAATHGDLISEIDIISGTAPPSLTENGPTTLRFLGLLARTTPWLLGGILRTQAWIAKHTSPSFIVSLYTSTENQDNIPNDIATVVKHDFIEAFTHHRSGAVTESRLFTQEWDFGLDEINSKVRFWHGSLDTMVSIDACQRLSDQIPNSQLTTFEDAGHLTTLLQSKKYVLQNRVPSER